MFVRSFIGRAAALEKNNKTQTHWELNGLSNGGNVTRTGPPVRSTKFKHGQKPKSSARTDLIRVERRGRHFISHRNRVQRIFLRRNVLAAGRSGIDYARE
jgi:hypothetical protein